MKSAFRLFVTFLILAYSVPVEAAFQYQPYSVRAAGMGNAFMASADEAAALFTNPAGIARLPYSELTFMYGKPFAGLPDVNLNLGHMAAAIPTRFGRIGFGLGLFQAQDLQQERTVTLSYGVLLRGKYQVGVNLKHLYHSYDIGSDPVASTDPIFQNGASKGALALDTGFIAPIGEFLKFGVSVRNINEPNVGIYSVDKVQREIQAGLAVDIAGSGLTATGDVFMRQPTAGTLKERPMPYLGLEKRLHKDFFLRAGANPLEFTTGFGLRKGRIGVDYGLVLARNLLEDNVGSHRISMTYRFGPQVLSRTGVSSSASIRPAARTAPQVSSEKPAAVEAAETVSSVPAKPRTPRAMRRATSIDPLALKNGTVTADSSAVASARLETGPRAGTSALAVTYDLRKTGQWVALSAPMRIQSAEGLAFTYKGSGNVNSLIVTLETRSGDVYRKQISHATGHEEWTSVRLPLSAFRPWGRSHGKSLRAADIRKISFIVAKKAGDEGWSGKLLLAGGAK
jgi:hypothetical protein